MKDHIQTLNYSAHAIEDLRELAATYRRVAPMSAIVLENLIEILIQSVKFILPNCGDIIDPDDLRQTHMDLARLPYPSVSFEASYNRTDDVQKIGPFEQLPATKRIALCWEPVPGLEVLPGLYKILDHFPDGGVFIVPIYWGPSQAKWTVALGGTFLPYNNELTKIKTDSPVNPVSRIANAALIESGLGSPNAKEFTCEPFYLFPEIFNGAVRQYGSVEMAYANISVDSRDETMMLIQACSVLNCANVITSDISPDLSINKKRIGSGKQPFFTYKVLQVSDERKQGNENNPLIEHSSPRMHLRRGHLRRLENKIVWVRPAIINPGSTTGAVLKDYSVKSSR